MRHDIEAVNRQLARAVSLVHAGPWDLSDVEIAPIARPGGKRPPAIPVRALVGKKAR